MNQYPKRLIEVDLPIKRISAHARREKSIRHGHISTLHIWWARRPLAACRAVICAALWPDPVDELCPQSFREVATQVMNVFAQRAMADKTIDEKASQLSMGRWSALAKQPLAADNRQHWNVLRFALLDFIADFANWDNSTHPAYLETSRALTQAAHEALGGLPGTRPLVVDPFAGGGAIPLEALRVGADAFASDLNPVAVLLNKVVLEYIPKYGQRLADEVCKWGAWVKEQAENELAEFYPPDPDGATPIAYLWARTITCEGPGCGAEVPLMRSLWLAKRRTKSVALKLILKPTEKRVDFAIVEDAKAKDVSEGTVTRGAATCPCCGYTTPVTSVRQQLSSRNGGANDSRIYAVVTTHPNISGRTYRLPSQNDLAAFQNAIYAAQKLSENDNRFLSKIPNETISLNEIRRITVPLYGMTHWSHLFSARQILAMTTYVENVKRAAIEIEKTTDINLALAIQTCLALAVDRCANQFNTLCKWNTGRELVDGAFARQALPILWDYGEINPLSGYWAGALEWILRIFENIVVTSPGQVEMASATAHPFPDNISQAIVTDPPYYDAVPYSHLSDFFYVWLRRSLDGKHREILSSEIVDKSKEIVVDRPHELSNSTKDIAFYENELTKAFHDGKRIVNPEGIGIIVFASKTTASWEAILKAVVEANWIITGSWPIDTEMVNRVSAQGQARLGSSIHLVCRPRETKEVGDWRDVLQGLPGRIHAWLPRLAQEGVMGADAIFACLGPALEIFSRYIRVERANGEKVELKDYLEDVWAAVAQEAMKTIFEDVDATDFEEDARLTVIWFWVMRTENGNGANDTSDEKEPGSPKKVSGYTMEYDTARKLAQGLGVDLHKLSRPGGIVTIKGGIATLNSVVSRETHLVGRQLALFTGETSVTLSKTKGGEKGPTVVMKTTEGRQHKLFGEEAIMPQSATGQLPLFSQSPEPSQLLMDRLSSGGQTTIDRLQQAMLLFGRSQTALLRPFLTETQMGDNPHFWKLARALSALYPPGSEEKRWVDGVIGRKKGLGF